MAREKTVLQAAKTYLLLYGHHVIGNRALAEGRDGLKPVQRRVIWAMHHLGALSQSKVVKQAKVVGDTMGDYHPHGNLAIEEAMIVLSQAKTKANLIEGLGNWGNHTDRPAAPRYIECFLSKYAVETMLDPDELACVPMIPSYSGLLKEPIYLPASFPHLLAAGIQGIAYGTACKIPPLTPEWILTACEKLLAGKMPTLPTEMAYAYGGRLISLDKEWLKTGKGRALFRPTFTKNPQSRELILTSLSPDLNVKQDTRRKEKPGVSVRKKKRPDVWTKVRERPDVYSISPRPNEKHAIRYVIELRKGTDFDVACKEIIRLFRTSVSYQLRYVTRESEEVYQPSTVGPIEYLKYWLKWRFAFVSKVAQYKIDNLKKANARLDLMIRLVDNRDKVVAVLKSATSTEIMRDKVQKILKCTSEEATYVLDSAIRRLSTLAKKDLLEKIKDNNALIKFEQKVVKSPDGRAMAQLKKSTLALSQRKPIE